MMWTVTLLALTLLTVAESVVVIASGLASVFRWWQAKSRKGQMPGLEVLNHLLPPVGVPTYLANPRTVETLEQVSFWSSLCGLALIIAWFLLTPTPSAGFWSLNLDQFASPLFFAFETDFVILVATRVVLRPIDARNRREKLRREAERRLS